MASATDSATTADLMTPRMVTASLLYANGLPADGSLIRKHRQSNIQDFRPSAGDIAKDNQNRDSPRIWLCARFLPLEQGIRHGFGAFAKPMKNMQILFWIVVPLDDQFAPSRAVVRGRLALAGLNQAARQIVGINIPYF